MSVPFANIPSTLRTPLFYAEVDPSHANTARQLQKTLILGGKTSSGTLAANIAELMTSVAAARAGAGPGSTLALMAEAYRQNDPLGEVWLLPLDDNGSAVAATGTFAFTGPSSAAGVLSVYIGAVLVTVPVTSGMSATAIAAALVAAINANTDLPVTAANSTGTVTVTAKNGGLTGNEILLAVNRLGPSGGQVLPAGVACTVTAMASGATNPVLTTALANLQDEPFDVIVCPWTDSTTLAALKAFLNDTAGRWSYLSQIYGHVFMAHRETAGNLATFGASQNDPHASIMGVPPTMPTPAWLFAAQIAGACAPSLSIDPGRPLTTLAVQGAVAPPLQSRFNQTNRNSLLYKGVSTFTVDRDGTVRIEKLISTYQTNAGGQVDDSYYDATTLFNLMYVLRALRAEADATCSRKKLASDGTTFAPGSAIVTPAIIRAGQIAKYRQLEFDGHVQKAEEFAAGLIVERATDNPRRVNILWPGTLVGGLDIVAVLVQFRNS